MHGGSTGKKDRVRHMFNDIAPRYDFLNHFLSMGIDIRWRNKVVSLAQQRKPMNILDVATGTADLAIALAACSPDRICGVDISEKMLAIGAEKIRKKGLDKLITLQTADSELLPFDSGSFDLATAAFGVRNFENLQQGIREMHRVLKSGGQIIILEFSRVRNPLLRALYNAYFRLILPLIGRLVSKHASAYHYLPSSVGTFPHDKAFLGILREAGFKNTDQQRLTGGIASIYTGNKK